MRHHCEFDSMLKVCFISSRIGWLKNDKQVLMDMANALLIRELIDKYGDNMALAIIALKDKRGSFDTLVSAGKVYAMPTPFSYVGGLLNTFRFYFILKKIAAENEMLIVQLPFIGIFALPCVHKPAVYHVCANVRTAAANPVKYSGVYRYISELFAGIMHQIYIQLFKRKKAKVIVNGKELAELYGKYDPQMVISSSIHQEDIIKESEIVINSNTPIRLLFVGRPSLEKGFDTLIDSLHDFPVDFRLSVVGFTLEEFQKILPKVFERSRYFHARLDFKGYVGWENGLRNIIRQSDLSIVPSRSEGTPRVILECMSQGVPVIASNVGGIPTIVQENINGLLIEPGSVQDLREKIIWITNNHVHRKKLISGGLKTAADNTITQFADHFINAVEQLTNE